MEYKFAVGSREWLKDIAVSIPGNKRKLTKKGFSAESNYKIKEDIPIYSLETSKREAAYFTRNIK
ncbi:MAG: hypothetical protein K9K32_07060 [Halanaerobiales bacterium]|nr:hypothetical protein [Halanaerobiales bacterium]